MRIAITSKFVVGGVGLVLMLSLANLPTTLLSLQHSNTRAYLPILSSDRAIPLAAHWRLIFLSRNPAEQELGQDTTEIYQINGNGAGLMPLTQFNSTILEAKWSPDGKKIAYSHHVPTQDGTHLAISVLDTSNGKSTQIMMQREFSDQVMWSPKGDEVAFVHHPKGYGWSDKTDEHIIMIYNLASGNLISVSSSITLFLGNPPSNLTFISDYKDPNETLFGYTTSSNEVNQATYLLRRDGTIEGVNIIGRLPTWSPTNGKIAYLRPIYEPRVLPKTFVAIFTIRDPLISFPPFSNVVLFPISVFNGEEVTRLVWSPSGTDLLIETYKSLNYNIYRIKADGTERLPQHITSGKDAVWMPDSQGIFFTDNHRPDNQVYWLKFDSTESHIQMTSFSNHSNWGLDVTP